MQAGASLCSVSNAPRVGALRSADDVAPSAAEALDHVAIRTANPDAVNELYGKGLGIRLALDGTFGALRMLFFRTGAVTLEFVADPSLGDEDKFYGLAFRVRDIQAAHAELAGLGFNVNDVRAGTKPGTRVFSVKSGTHGVPTFDHSRSRPRLVLARGRLRPVETGATLLQR